MKKINLIIKCYLFLLIPLTIYLYNTLPLNFYAENLFIINQIKSESKIYSYNYPDTELENYTQEFLSEDYWGNETYNLCIRNNKTLFEHIRNTSYFKMTTRGNSKKNALSCIYKLQDKIIFNENVKSISFLKKNKKVIEKLEKNYGSNMPAELEIYKNNIQFVLDSSEKEFFPVAFQKNISSYSTLNKLFLLFAIFNLCILLIVIINTNYLKKYFSQIL